MELPPNIINDKIPLIEHTVRQNILLKYFLQQTSLKAISSFSNLAYSKRDFENLTDNNTTPYVIWILLKRSHAPIALYRKNIQGVIVKGVDWLYMSLLIGLVNSNTCAKSLT